MAAKKANRLTALMPYVILLFVLLGSILILFDMVGNLISEDVLQINQQEVDDPIDPIEAESTPIPIGPTPTLEPIIDA